MIRFELEQDQITPRLQDLSRLLADLTPVMQEIGEQMVTTTKARFAAGEAPDGTKWAPKAQATLDSYARRGQRIDIRPLFGETGMLASQIFYEAAADSVEIGSNLIYAAAQQFGAAQGAFGADKAGHPIPWGTIPSRPFLGVSESDETTIIQIISDWLGSKGV